MREDNRVMTSVSDSNVEDERELASFGYPQRLLRGLGSFKAFAVSFALMSVTTGIVLTFSLGLSNAGPSFIMWWPVVAAGTFFIALTFANLSGKLPITGYAYQWTSRLISNDVGWFVGWIALVGWMAGTAGIAFGLAGWLLPLLNIPTDGYNVAITATLLLATYTVLNVMGIKVVSWISQIASPVEVVSSLVLGLVLIVIALGRSLNPVSIITSTGDLGQVGIAGFALAALTSLWTLQTFEAASEFAEETVEARTVVPLTIMRTWGVGVIVGAVLLLGLVLALPNIADTLAAPVPVLYVIQQAVGDLAAPFFWVVLIIAVFSCGLASLTAAARLTFSMARDNVLPFSGALSYVSPSLRTPTWASIVVGILASAICFSADALAVLGGVAALSWYIVYVAAIAAALWALRKRSLAEYRIAGAFDLGRWTGPIAVIAMVWSLFAILLLTLPEAIRVNGAYAIGALVVGAIWYVLVLRGRINAGTAGAARVAPLATIGTSETAAAPPSNT